MVNSTVRKSKIESSIIYEGTSTLLDAQIVVIATIGTKNRKTGEMVQTWILLQEMSPTQAVKQSMDVAICGDCPLRGISGKRRACYVNVGQAPRQIWEKYFRRGYPYGMVNTAGHMVRLGAYGDPAVVPIDIWYELLRNATGHTGYTHQWRTCDQDFRKLVMASVETPADAELAHAMGWRTFRTKLPSLPVLRGEFVCPASAESNHRLNCEQCGACNGGNPLKASVVINGHGGAGVMPVITSFLQSVN